MKRIILLLVIGVIAMALAFSCSGDPKKETKPDTGDTTIQETLKVTEEPGSDSTTGTPSPAPPKGIIQETLQVPEEPVEKKGK
jgi:hypothetical protein